MKEELMRKNFWIVLGIALLTLTIGAVAQQGPSECTLAGTWYGGSVVAYQMTITPALPSPVIAFGPYLAFGDTYIVHFDGMYKNAVLNTSYTGLLKKNGTRYEGMAMALVTNDPDFLKPPPIGKMPDLLVGMNSFELVDCNSIRNTMPFFGRYFAASIWNPGVEWLGVKTPLVDAPDVDMLNMLTGGQPVIETYHRLPQTINPHLLHR